METINAASREWATRPDDERYTSLAELKTAVLNRKRECWTATPDVKALRAMPLENNGIGIELYDPTHGGQRVLEPSNWSFGQLSQYAGAPAAYLRKLPAELACINLQWGLERMPMRDDALILGQSNGRNMLRAMTSTSYGRIWDHQVVESVERINGDGRWQIPAASHAATNPKRATTLYASDRDVFIFLVDPAHPVEVNGETLFRGFYTWNSEVGSAVFGICTFLYRFVCDNRIIWGSTNVRELRVVHRGGAPERFAYEGAKYLRQYAEESTTAIVQTVKAAKDYAIPVTNSTVGDWLQSKGFSRATANASVNAAVAEEGQARSLWDIVNGITAYARSIPHTNDRVDLETKAGNLMRLVA